MMSHTGPKRTKAEKKKRDRKLLRKRRKFMTKGYSSLAKKRIPDYSYDGLLSELVWELTSAYRYSLRKWTRIILRRAMRRRGYAICQVRQGTEESPGE